MIWGLKTLKVSEKGIVIIFTPYHKGHLGITPPTVLKKISAWLDFNLGYRFELSWNTKWYLEKNGCGKIYFYPPPLIGVTPLIMEILILSYFNVWYMVTIVMKCHGLQIGVHLWLLCLIIMSTVYSSTVDLHEVLQVFPMGR